MSARGLRAKGLELVGNRKMVLAGEETFHTQSIGLLTAAKQEKFAKNKKNTSTERLSLLLFKVWYFSEYPVDLLTFLKLY